jgi:hypothetical protein
MRSDLNVHTPRPSLSITAVCAIAATALVVAMGIGRFAFTPLLPLMVGDGSLAQSAGAWLAASNYLGYLICHLLMAAGVTLPSVRLAPVSIAIAAPPVGSTFMLVTMIGMQEGRALTPGNPTRLLGLMTAAFAIGQLAGPVVAGTLELLPIGPTTALGYALRLAAFALALSAAYLWRHSHNSPSN